MKNFTLFFSLFLVMALTSCEKESTTAAFDLNGEYEVTIDKTTTISNSAGVISENIAGEVFQVTISEDRFSRTDKVVNEQTVCEGKVAQKDAAVFLTIDQCNGTSISGRYNYNEQTKTLTRSIQTNTSEDCNNGNCGNDDSRADTPVTTTKSTYILQAL